MKTEQGVQMGCRNPCHWVRQLHMTLQSREPAYQPHFVTPVIKYVVEQTLYAGMEPPMHRMHLHLSSAPKVWVYKYTTSA